MAHSNCVKRIKLSFIDLNSRINKYHTGVVQFQRAVCHHCRLTGRHSCVKKTFLLQHSILRCTRRHTPNFSVGLVNVNSVLSLNQMKIASISNSFEQVYLGWQFASVSFFSRHLLKHFKLRLRLKNDLYDTHQLAPLSVSNDEFVAGLTGLIPSRLPWSHFL